MKILKRQLRVVPRLVNISNVNELNHKNYAAANVKKRKLQKFNKIYLLLQILNNRDHGSV